MGRRAFLFQEPQKVFCRGSDRHGAGSTLLRRFSPHASELDHPTSGGGDFRPPRAGDTSAIRVSCLQRNAQSGRFCRGFLFALARDQEPAMAFRRMAVTHYVRYSYAHRELLPNAILMAGSYAIRRRHCVVYTLVHVRELRDYDHCLFGYVLVSP